MFCCFQQLSIGKELENYDGAASLTMRHPIEFSYVSNWDYMEKIWQYLFHTELDVSPEDQPVLISEPPMNPKSNREKTTEIMFERFNTPAFFLVKEVVMSLFNTKQISGVVLQSGDGFTFAVPIYEGCSIPSATIKMPLAGRELTQHMNNLLTLPGDKGQLVKDWDVCRTIKETLCYVADDFKQESSKSPDTFQRTHTLPNGQSMLLGIERFKCPEALFQPRLYGVEFGGFHEFLNNSIQKCHTDIQADMYSNIFLSGGNTMFLGLVSRLQKELSSLVPEEIKVKVHDTPERHLCAWKGGSLMASDDTLLSMFIQKDEYDEHGPTIVHRKCYL